MSIYKIKLDDDEEIETVTNVNFSLSFENKGYIATIDIMDANELDKIKINDNIYIYQDDDLVFTGSIIDYDSKSDSNIKITIENDYTNILNFDAGSISYYNVDSHEIIEKLITKEIDNKGLEIVNTGSDLTDVDSDVPIFELANFSQISPQKFGDDLIFLGFPKDEDLDDQYKITFSDLDFKGDILQKIESRLILNNLSGIINITIQYIDSDQKNYVWDLSDNLNNVAELELKIEEARDIEKNKTMEITEDNENKLRFIIDLDGKPVENIAMAIDNISIISVDLKDRNIDLNIDLDKSNRKIKRKFSDTVGEAIQKITEEENKIIKIFDNEVNIIEYAENDSEITLTEESPITSFNIDTNKKSIINKVIIEAKNDIKISESNESSIEFYGFINTQKKRDLSITTTPEAREKAKAILNKKAYKDTIITINLPENYITDNNIQIGDIIFIDKELITGEFVVEEINIKSKEWSNIKVSINEIST